jgi:hypothetical protein
MKKAIMITITVIITLSSICAYADIYPTTAIVREIDYDNDVVYCEDCNGDMWAFEGIEDWDIDDIVSMIMDDNDTEWIHDDIIVQIRYGGYAEGL